ncbi:MAG: cation transporter [Planctomycetes bacterium]|nr:cation transporter [Planctomycetota bacterium]
MASTKTAIIAAILGNGGIAITKLVASAITGSAAMLAEAIHSIVDTGNGALLLLGIHRSKKPADEEHPFGYGKELYFWTLVVAMIIFGAGGGISIYEGIKHLVHPRPITNPTLNYWVLGIALVLEGAAWYIALKGFLAVKGQRSIWRAVRTSKDPTTFAVLLEDSAALLGILIAFAGIALGQVTGIAFFDPLASVIIGVLLAVIAIVLARESRDLLVGESAEPKTVRSIQSICAADADVEHADRPLTVHFGPDKILVNLDVKFRSVLTADEIEHAVDRLEQSIRDAHPDVARIYIEAERLRATRGETGPASDVSEAPS